MEINQPPDSKFKSDLARLHPPTKERFESLSHGVLKTQSLHGTQEAAPKTDSALELSPTFPKNKLWLAPSCQKHGQKQEFYCKICQQLLCTSCVMLKDHLGHAIVDPIDCIESLKEGLKDDLLTQLDASFLDRQQKMDTLSAWLKELDVSTSTQIQRASDVSQSDLIPFLEEQHGQFQNELQLKLRDLMLAQDQLLKLQKDIQVALMDQNPYHLAQQFRGFKDSQAKIRAVPSLKDLAIPRVWKRIQESCQGYILASDQDVTASAIRPNRHTDILFTLSLSTPLPSFCALIPVSVEYWVTGYPKAKVSLQMMPGTMIPICPCGSRGNSTGTLMIKAQSKVFEFPLHLLTF